MELKRKGPSGKPSGVPINVNIPPEHTWRKPVPTKSTFGRDIGTITGASIGGFEGAIIGGTLGSLIDD